MAGGDTSGWFLRLRRHRLLQRLVELDVQAAHALGEPAELHVDAAAAPRHHGHRAGHVADGSDIRGQRALPHLRGLFRDPLAQLLDGVRRGGAVRLELGDQVLHDVDGPLKLVDLLDAAQLLGAEFLLRHGRAQGLPSSASANTRPDRKSTRLNSSHLVISYAVFCLKKKITGSIRRKYSSSSVKLTAFATTPNATES